MRPMKGKLVVCLLALLGSCTNSNDLQPDLAQLRSEVNRLNVHLSHIDDKIRSNAQSSSLLSFSRAENERKIEEMLNVLDQRIQHLSSQLQNMQTIDHSYFEEISRIRSKLDRICISKGMGLASVHPCEVILPGMIPSGG
jgi:predicted  nucleic acid-binding Zn-ribbon protein